MDFRHPLLARLLFLLLLCLLGDLLLHLPDSFLLGALLLFPLLLLVASVLLREGMDHLEDMAQTRGVMEDIPTLLEEEVGEIEDVDEVDISRGQLSHRVCVCVECIWFMVCVCVCAHG